MNHSQYAKTDHTGTYLLIKSLLRTILLNLASVLLARNLKNMDGYLYIALTRH